MRKNSSKYLFNILKPQRSSLLIYILLILIISFGTLSCSAKGRIFQKEATKNDEKLKGSAISLYTPKKLLAADSKEESGKKDEDTIVHISGAISEIQKQSGATSVESKIETKPEVESKDNSLTKVEPVGKKEAPKSFELKEGKISGINQDDPPIPQALQGQKFVFNFSKMDIISVIKIIAEELKFNYIVENGVGGVVTLQTENSIPYEYLFPVLKQILATYNLAIVKEDKYYKIAPMTDIQRKPIGTYVGKDGKYLPPDHSMVIQLVPLSYLPPDQLREVLSPLLSSNGTFINFPVPKLLGIIDNAANIRRLLDIISALDINTFGSMNVQLFKIMFGKAAELNTELIDIFSTLGLAQKDGFLKFVAIPRINSILAISANKEYLDTLETWIKKLDIPEAGAGVLGTYIYRVQNGDAGNIAGIVQALFKVKSKGDGKVPEFQPTDKIGFTPLAPKGLPGQPQPKVVPSPSGKRSIEISGVTEIEGELQIVSDAATNSIIIRTNPIYYPVILETIRELDKIPMQVMIEILVAELTLDKSTQFGVEWAMERGQAGVSLDGGSGLGSQLDKEVFASVSGGVSYFIHDSKKIFGLIKAKANDSKLNILSSPVILTSDNKQASIKITSDVPIQQTTSNNTTGQVTQSIEYKSAGIKLSVTPRINSEKFVSMDILQEVSQVGEKAAGSAPSDPPPFFTREAQTSVVVKDLETLVIGGLITNTERSARGGIPWLSRIPFLGWLFGNWADSNSKTELILLITPRVIETVSDGRKLTDAFKERIEFLQYKVNKDKT